MASSKKRYVSLQMQDFSLAFFLHLSTRIMTSWPRSAWGAAGGDAELPCMMKGGEVPPGDTFL